MMIPTTRRVFGCGSQFEKIPALILVSVNVHSSALVERQLCQFTLW
jgi:hypothetical protein